MSYTGSYTEDNNSNNNNLLFPINTYTVLFIFKKRKTV